MSNPVFQFVVSDESGYNHNKRYLLKGPHYGYGEKPLIKEDGLYTLDEVLLLPLSKTNKKKAQTLKEGNTVRLYRKSSGSCAYLRRVTNDELEYKDTVETISSKIKGIKKEIRLKCPELFKELNELEAQLRKLKKTAENS